MPLFRSVTHPEFELTQALRPGELLLWFGKPPAGLQLCYFDVVLIPASVLAAVFAGYWTYSVISNLQTATWLFLPFLPLIWWPAVYGLAGRFFVDAWRRERTAYGLTDQRAIVICGLSQRTIWWKPYHCIKEIAIIRKQHGYGTLQLERIRPFENAYAGTGDLRWMMSTAMTVPICFESIPDVDAVAELVEQQIPKSAPRTDSL